MTSRQQVESLGQVVDGRLCVLVLECARRILAQLHRARVVVGFQRHAATLRTCSPRQRSYHL